MERRTFLELLAAGVITAATATAAGFLVPRLIEDKNAAGFGTQGSPLPKMARDDTVYPTGQPFVFDAPSITKIPVPYGTINAIPEFPGTFALTVDDGISSEVVREYTRFCKRTGMRMTFFVTGQYPSWADNASALRPLVESGQVQLANHTWSHPSLLKTSDGGVTDELGKTHDFLFKTYGVDGTPYFRPPFGNHDARVDSIAARLGYTTPVMWHGSLSDAGQITPEQLREFAHKWIGEQRIVIGHANFPAVTQCFDYITELIQERKLQPVTLNDLFLKA
ncbi:peptidoglycan/xylan/chitin deacetylase (PgdA/CDA1 family) [Aurantimicrobium minutum]|uniref:polysaccharide deacetylase family protein n=1 Tax=Aurantimicrobium minutum TaxID=708131 RepID=UPI002476949D|nr:polysaccharide deacetylase family protein [Aurantimicrobium minutum]MDH6531889.1 peptidoglycan/xylan/chitin deacetylase (PgdA/CDA1 family) [Aurantimicrobium minutum]